MPCCPTQEDTLEDLDPQISLLLKHSFSKNCGRTVSEGAVHIALVQMGTSQGCKQWWDILQSHLMPGEFAAAPLAGMSGLSLFQFNWGQRGIGGFLWCFRITQKEQCQAFITWTLLVLGCCFAVHSHTFCVLPLCTAWAQVAVREHDKGIKLQVGSRFPSLLVCMCVCLCFFCAVAQGGS